MKYFLSLFFLFNVTVFSISGTRALAAVEKAESLTVAMTTAFVSEVGTGIYAQISDYFENKTGVEIKFLTGPSYATVNSMVEAGATDVAFVCGYPCILSYDNEEVPSMGLLAAPVVEDSLFDDVRTWHQMALDADFMEIK